MIIELTVVPNSGKLKFFIDKSGLLKCYLKSSPEKGRANEELIKFMAKSLKIQQRSITIISGHTSRKKRIKIELEIDQKEFLNLLGL
ncbi:DUF167 domain-containing protein [Candidatus Dependentiae bacterium]|nr:DUF167 domain-containing protein [Candidatus Dependentiae bacterium]MBU4387741.1 DUF167 domain-containing protein [Candidatus Dependentiae bacterium]MCG2756333.1 DUF167 domain-containing protein [Candidatus Dependentiae bacterium]